MAEKPKVFAHYYTWYSTPSQEGRDWGHWGQTKPSVYCPEGASPEKVIFPPFIREINSCAYPLIGPYDSDDPEVVRWHIQLAQAAGIDAFSVDWWGSGSWQRPSGLTYNAFADAVLPMAEEENFKVFLFDETFQFVDDIQSVINWMTEYLPKFRESPAYLHIDGKPVYAIYVIPWSKRTPERLQKLRDEVESKIGPIYWIVDRIISRAAPEEGKTEFAVPEEWLALDWVDMFMGYSTFALIRRYKYEEMKPLCEGVVQQVHAAGRKVMLPIHPGHNNSKLNTGPWVMPREDGGTFRGYLRAAKETGADYVCITSFNEWPETTVIEPARTWLDPYQYLKILADWNGVDFKKPEEPDRIKSPETLE